MRAARTSRTLAVAALALCACGSDRSADRGAPPAPASASAAPGDAAAPGRDDAARLLAERLRRGGATVDYDRAAFQLVVANDGGPPTRINLGNFYAAYAAATPADRDGLLALWSEDQLHPPVTPKSYLMARRRLFPLVRDGAYFDEAALGAAARGGTIGSRPARRPLDELLAFGIALDSPTTMSGLADDQLAAWHVDWDRARADALDNLRARSAEPFTEPRPGVFVSPWRDGYDTARLLLTDVIGALAVHGRPLALVPNRDTLIVVGDRDTDALLAAADLAEQAYAAPRPIDLVARCLDGATWTPCLPDVTPAVDRRYRAMRIDSIAALYQHQKALLEAGAAQRGDDVFVASYVAVAPPDGSATSVAVLTRGVRTLLPHADVIAVVDADRPAHEQILAQVPWDALFSTVGARWTPQGLSPERWQVGADGFPTAAELARLARLTR